MANPFDDVEFTSQNQPAVSPDVLTALMNMGQPARTGFAPGAQADTTGGMDRVNANTSKTGVTAYKDGSGRTTLTNEKIIDLKPGPGPDIPYTDVQFTANNPLVDGKMPDHSPIVTDTPNATSTAVSGIPNGSAGSTPSITQPTGIFTILSQLRSAKDAASATSLYESYQQTSAEQKTKIEQEAIKFAESKIGIPDLETQLVQAQAADRADPKYYPGIGPSPMTQKIMSDLNILRGSALEQSKVYLGSNLTYKSLSISDKTAEKEFQRVQNTFDKRETKTLQDQSAQTEWDRRRDALTQEKTDAKQAQLEQESQAITAPQLARIISLNQADFVGTDPEAPDARIRALQVVKRNKNKDFAEAVTAEENDLPILALKGNGFAKKLVMQHEMSTTGATEQEVDTLMKVYQQRMQEPKFIENTFKKRYENVADKKAMKEQLGQFQAMSLDPTKKVEATTAKAQMALEGIQQDRTTAFANDVGTWKSTDPTLNAAIETARKQTGRTDVENVLTAYMGNANNADRLIKGQQFMDLAKLAASKQDGSFFGSPNYRVINPIVVEHMRKSGFYRAMLESPFLR